MSRPLATRLVPTRTSSRPSRECVDDPLGGTLALDDVAVEPADAQTREALADLALDTFRAATEVADPRRRAAGQRLAIGRRGPAVMAAQRAAGRVVDERPLALGTGLDVAAVATHHDRRGAPPVDDEDRPLAGGRVERAESGADEPAEISPRLPAASSARRSTTSTSRRASRSGGPGGRLGGRFRRGRGRPYRRPASRCPRTTAAPASRPSSIAMSRAWSRGVRSLL